MAHDMRNGAARPRVVDTRGRVPRHDLDAEAAVLSASLLKQDAARAAIGALQPEHFYSEQNGIIFRAIRHVLISGQPVDLVAVAAVLRDHGRLGQVGGTAYLAQIVDATPAVANIDHHCAIVREAAQLRQLVAECQTIAAEGYGDTGPIRDFLAQAEHRVATLVKREQTGGLQALTMKQLLAPPAEKSFVARDLDLGVGRPALLVAPGYLGKTIVAQSIVIDLALGERIFGHFHAPEAAMLAHLDFEIGADLLLTRYRRLVAARGHAWPEVAKKLRIASLPKLYLNSPGIEAHLRSFVEGCTLCIVDSARRALPGEDENDSAITVHLDTLTRVSLATGCAFIVIHHASTKQQPGMAARAAPRGSSAFFDCAGAVFIMSGEKGEPARVSHEKAPTHGRTVEDFFVHIEDVELDGDPRAGLRVRYLTEQQVNPPRGPSARFDGIKAEVLAVLRAKGPLSKTRIAAMIGKQKATVLEAVDELFESRTIGQSERGFHVL